MALLPSDPLAPTASDSAFEKQVEAIKALDIPFDRMLEASAKPMKGSAVG
jgi:hypothetical protein